MRALFRIWLVVWLGLSVQADSRLWLTSPDGTKASYDSYEQAADALQDLLVGEGDGRLVLSYEGRQIVIVKTGQSLEVSVDSGPPTKESLQGYLEKLNRARDLARQALCRENLRTLRRALDSWVQDHHGGAPESLQVLVPAYLQEIPRCPFSNNDSYSEAYIGSSQCRCGANHPGRE